MTARHKAGHQGLLERGRSQSGTKRREVWMVKLCTIHSTPSPWRPGAMDGVSPPLATSQGCEQETTSAGDDWATARGRAPECVSPLAPSQGCEQGTTMAVP